MLHAFLASLIVMSSADSAPVDLTSRAKSAYHQYVGKRVTVCGTYSPRGKIAGYVTARSAFAYLVDYPYDTLREGQHICVTGVLHFQPEITPPPETIAAGIGPYFCFTRDDSSIRPLESKRRYASNQTMKPTALLRCVAGVIATTPWISSRFPASLVRFASSRSRTPAVLFSTLRRGLSLSR
jgi:hypothetical protein